MTMGDDLHYKLANVTEALAKERSKYDSLRKDHDRVLHDLRKCWRGNCDLRRENDQLREQLRRDERPMQRFEDLIAAIIAAKQGDTEFILSGMGNEWMAGIGNDNAYVSLGEVSACCEAEALTPRAALEKLLQRLEDDHGEAT